MSLDDFKRGYQAGGDAYRRKVGQWSNWVVFFLAFLLTESAVRVFGLKWYASLALVVLVVLLLGILFTFSKRFFAKSPPA